MKLFGIALALAFCGASAAKADWEYTKWGMTPGQVAGAAKNLVKKSSDLHPDSDGNVTKLVAPYRNGKFSFEAQFGFDAARCFRSDRRCGQNDRHCRPFVDHTFDFDSAVVRGDDRLADGQAQSRPAAGPGRGPERSRRAAGPGSAGRSPRAASPGPGTGR